jgi:type I restriction enzyme, S subunit
VTTDWEIRRLGDLFDITSSRRVFESDWTRHGVPFYRAREIVKLANQGFVENELFISEEMFSEYSAKYGQPAEGDIMVTGVGTLGVCYVVREQDRFYFKDGNIIWLKKKAAVDSRFVAYAFQSDLLRRQIDDSVGVTVGTYTIVKAKSTLIPLPSLPEQQRIVGILDQAFEGIAVAKANAERNLQNVQNLPSLSFAALASTSEQRGWTRTTVAAVAARHKGSIRTGPFGSQLLHSEFVDQGIAVLGIDNAVANEFRWDQRRFITPEKYRGLERYRVHPGDVLITIMGTCGRCAVVPSDIPLAINTKHLCCITVDGDRCLPEYLQAYFLYHPAAREFLSKRAKGAIMAGLNMGIIEELPVMLPSAARQREIIDGVALLTEEARSLGAMYQRKLAALEDLKKSLLHQAFTGQLRSEAA